MDKLAQELAAEIDKIDFDGGLAPAGVTPAASTPEPVKPAEPAAEPVTPTPVEPKVDETPVEPAGVPAATPAAKPAEPADDKGADTSPAIPDSHYRAALHMGMKAEEVGELYDQNPALALKTLAKCYEMVNASSKQLGELGQRARQLRDQPPAAPVVIPNRKEAVLKELKKKYEDDPIIDLIGELIPDTVPVPEIKGFRPQPATPDPQVEIERQVAVRQEINNFFGADEMNVYDDFYGKVPQTGDWQSLTPGQRANRIEVCNRAQNILDGAAFSGMQLSAAEAMERAHLEVAAPISAEIVRERIVKSITKRAAGVTLKPSGSKTPAPAAGAYSKETAIQEVGVELRKVFG